MKRILWVAGVLPLFSILLVLLFHGHVLADLYNLYEVNTSRVAYTGTVSKYDTSGNLVGTWDISSRPDGPYRDAIMYIWSSGANGYTAPYANFFTNVISGTNNPNYTPDGFIQVTDYGAPSTSNTGFFHGFNGTNYTEYTLHVTAANLSLSYLWNANGTTSPPPSNPYANTGGIFQSYQLDITFGGLAGTAGNGAIYANNDPNSVNGTFSGIFKNSTDGLKYVADFTFAMNNWAYASGNSGGLVSEFWGYAQPDPVPLPPSIFMLGPSLIALGLARNRRCKTLLRRIGF